MRQVVVNDLVFGSGRMKICVPVCEKTTEAVLDAVKEIKTTPADLIEWRIDYFDEDMFAAAPEIFKAAAPLPVLCTFRTKAEGGEKAISHGLFCDERAAERLGCAACRFRAFPLRAVR